MRSILFSFVLILGSALHATVLPGGSQQKGFHLDLDMRSSEYQALLQQRPQQFSLVAGQLDDILATGKRNLDFLKLVNSKRNVLLSLSTEATQEGNGIDTPRIYNPALIRQKYVDLQAAMPKELAAVIFGSDPLPDTLPVKDEVYIEWGLKTDRVYQIAARWLLMEPYLPQLAARRSEDIRGYYYLGQVTDLTAKLQGFHDLTATEQTQYSEWLVMLCGNSGGNLASCQNVLKNAIASRTVLAYFNRYNTYGKKVWDGMMFIPDDGRFPHVQWNADTDVRIPFKRTNDPAMNAFFQKNIEEEWQSGNDFVLKIDFDLKSDHAIVVNWVPGTTPHVPYLGASEIVMDANSPISEYDVQWTIRHEFGHNLGFPDCYVEFYDSTAAAMVSYQLDTTDVMCSRKGHLKPRHVTEMKRVYGH